MLSAGGFVLVDKTGGKAMRMNFTRWVKIIPAIALAGLFGAGIMAPEKASVAPISASRPQLRNAAISALQATLTVVANDDAYSTNQATTLVVAAPGLLINDTATNVPANTVIDVFVNSNVSHGFFSDSPNDRGSFSYFHLPGFFGVDTFIY